MESAASRLKRLLSEISPLIEEQTRKVCPDCRNVCCRQKHGTPDQKDLLFFDSLGVKGPKVDMTRPPEGPCEFLSSSGCILERWMRPFRCTWYFCAPLLAAMEEGPQRSHRKLVAMMDEIVRLHGELRP